MCAFVAARLMIRPRRNHIAVQHDGGRGLEYQTAVIANSLIWKFT
jgi:hypothetical protein